MCLTRSNHTRTSRLLLISAAAFFSLPALEVNAQPLSVTIRPVNDFGAGYDERNHTYRPEWVADAVVDPRTRPIEATRDGFPGSWITEASQRPTTNVRVPREGQPQPRATADEVRDRRVPPFPPRPDTTVSFYRHADFSGDSYTSSFSPFRLEEAPYQVKLVNQILYRRVSSVRLHCGERDSDVYLFDSAPGPDHIWTNWGGNVLQLSCKAHETVDFNLHNLRGWPDNTLFGDRAAQAFVLLHAPRRRSIPLFSSVVNVHWNQFVKEFGQRLGPGSVVIRAQGEPTISLIDACREYRVTSAGRIRGCGDPNYLTQSWKTQTFWRTQVFKFTQRATASYLFCEDRGTLYAEARIVSPRSGYGLPIVEFVASDFDSDDRANPWHGEFMCELFNRHKEPHERRGVREELELAKDIAVRTAVGQVQTALNQTIETKAPFYRARTFYLSAQPLGSLSLESDGLGPPFRDPPAKD